MPLINFDDITPKKRPTQAGLINFNAIAGPDMRLTMPTHPTPPAKETTLPKTPPLSTGKTAPTMLDVRKADEMSDKKSGLHLSQWNPATTTSINPQQKTFSEQLRGLADKLSYDPDRFDGWVDTFNYNVGKTIWGANAPPPGDPGHNRWVDLLMNIGTIAVGVVGTIKAVRLVGSYIQEASKFIKTIQTAKSQPANKEVTTLSPVFKKTADVYRQFAWKGDAVDPKIVADALFDVDPTMNKATADAMAKYILDPSMGAVSDVAAKKTMEQATPVLIRMAEKLSPMEVTTIAKQAEAAVLSRYGAHSLPLSPASLPSPSSKPAISLGGNVQSTPQVIAAGGKVAEPQVVTTPTVSADKYEVAHPLPERPNSTAKKHLPLKADADISAFIEKHAALTEKPEAVMDKTVPAINPQKSGSVDITDRVDLASVQVKYPTATTVVLDPKRRTVMFLHDTTPLEAIAIDRPQLKAWYGIDGEKILAEITRPAEQPAIVRQAAAQTAEEKIAALQKQYKRELATPLMSEGSISPSQVGTMSEKQRERFLNDGQTRMRVEREIDLLRHPEEVKAIEDYTLEQKRQARINQLERHIADLKQVGISPKTGKIRPSYQKAIAEAEKELEPLKSGGKLEISNDGAGISTPAPPSSSPRSPMEGSTDTGLVPQNLATQEGTSTSDYVMDISPQSMAAQADRQLNGSREGYVTLNTLNPVHWVNELVKNDPLAKGLDKIGLYTLLYGKEEMAAIRAGRGNPSLFAMRPVPNVVKRNFIWGYGFSPDTLDEMKDVRVRARTMYGKLAELEDQTIKFGKDQFLAMIRFISGFPTGKNTALATSAGKPVDPALLPAYDLAEQWGQLEEWFAYNLIHDGQIDPKVFGRLAGRYIPAPYDSMGEMLRPLEEAEHVRPSLVFLKHQSMTPDQIIAFASQGDNWEKYRTFFFQRMRSEIRAAEKGGVFNAIAADPKTGIMPPELAPKKGYVEVDDAMNAFGLKGAAVPQWVADFIHNEFIDVQVAQQLQGYSEVLGWYKFLRVGANIPTFIRNVVSQLTVQMLEGNVGPLDLEHYLIKPMGVLLGMDKAGKQELVAMGLWDNNIAREMEGLQFTPEEKALWNTGDRTVAITAFVNRIKNFRSRASSIYGLADAYTKAATYFANKDEYGARGARNIAFLTSGDYTSRPPIVNFLSRGVWKGKASPALFLISNPFAFYRTVVEPQRVGYDLVHHPSLVVGAVAAAYFVIKGVAKRVAKEYDISEEQAAGLITELQNYEWLKGRAVLPISGEQAIDLTDLIPMVSYLTTFQQELASHEDLFREIFKWGGLIFGSNNPNFVLNIIATWVTGNDFAAEWRYGRTYRVGDTTWAKLKWTAKQLLPSWITRTLENTKTGNFSITDIIGSYIATASDEDKINFYNSLRKNPQYDAKELNRIYSALFEGTSLTGK